MNYEVLTQIFSSGGKIDKDAIIEWLDTYEEVAIYGCGSLGKLLYAKLANCGVNISVFFDNNADCIGQYLGVPVTRPTVVSSNDLVIVCIDNVVTPERYIFKELKNSGYKGFIISGKILLNALCCTLSVGIEGVNPADCSGVCACEYRNCERYAKIFTKNNVSSLIAKGICIQVTFRCNLHCKHCVEDVHNYPQHLKKFLDTATYSKYVNNICLAFDYVGTLSLAGGEPFLHPHLLDLVQFALQKKTIGAVVIVSNGTVPIDKQMLKLMSNDKLIVEFSDYSMSLTVEQLAVRENNMRLLKLYGVRFILYPIQWWERPEIRHYDNSIEEMSAMKQRCPIECSSIVDNKYMFCPIIRRRINILNNASGSDYVDFSTNVNIKERVREYINRPFFDSCQYCDFKNLQKLQNAGEQAE
jgi:Predicted Fe-S oxidoreductases